MGFHPLPRFRAYLGASTPKLGAAQNRCWIGLKHWIDCDNGQPVFEGLTHQHAVKRVTVDSRQGRELTDTGFIQGETRNLMAYALWRARGSGSSCGVGRSAPRRMRPSLSRRSTAVVLPCSTIVRRRLEGL